MCKSNLVDINFQACHQLPGLKCHTSNSFNILKQILFTHPEANLISDLPQAHIQEFQLGHDLSTFNSLVPDNTGTKQTIMSDCFFICEGRVRLLCQNLLSSRLVPAVTLEAGEYFGADSLFCANPLPYRAIAASSGRVARIPYSQLNHLSQQTSPLYQYLHKTAQEREYLIFFKRYTHLYSYPSSVLKQVLLPRLVKQDIKAGTLLADATPANTGRFWLRSGQIGSQTHSEVTISVGDSWGHPTPIPADWVAQTDLIIYKLSLDP